MPATARTSLPFRLASRTRQAPRSESGPRLESSHLAWCASHGLRAPPARIAPSGDRIDAGPRGISTRSFAGDFSPRERLLEAVHRRRLASHADELPSLLAQLLQPGVNLGEICRPTVGVLNARGHRSGEITVGRRTVGAPAVLNARRHRSGEIQRTRARRRLRSERAQRPKASERGDRSQRSTRHGERLGVLNARRHRSGENSRANASARRHDVCSTPEGIGAGRTAGPRSSAASSRVLNARGHRSGENSPRASMPALDASGAQRPRASERGELDERRCRPTEARWCSTPEGIGAGRTRASRERRRSCAACAQRPKASEREEPGVAERMRRCDVVVLNARRHRSGEIAADELVARRSRRCAQRPKASERENSRGATSLRRQADVLNARRHRSGENRRHVIADVLGIRCAQRPKASERGNHGDRG